jgi:DNA-binding response OmpR family regulator
MKTHILIVEDQINLAHFVALELMAAGYQVTVEKDAQRGAIAAQVLCPNGIVMSWDLPVAASSKLYAQLQTMGSKVPIIGTTVDAKKRYSESQKDEITWLVKPFSMQDLLNAIVSTLHFADIPQSEQLLRMV